MGARFEVSTSEQGGRTVVTVQGEVDMDTSPQLRDAIQGALRARRELRVVLDGVQYLDSSGIAVLIQGLKWAQKEGVGYTLVDPSPQVRQVIDLAQLDQLFRIEMAGQG